MFLAYRMGRAGRSGKWDCSENEHQGIEGERQMGLGGVGGRKRAFRFWANSAIKTCLLIVGVLLVLTASASGATPERLRSFGPDGTEASDFLRIGSVAIDQQSGSVYVLDTESGSLYKFDAEGHRSAFGGSEAYISGNRIDGIAAFGGQAQSQVAVDSTSHVVYVTEEHAVRAFTADGEPADFTAGPGAGSNEISGFTELNGVAVDGNGNIYASDRAGTISIFAPSGEQITSFTAATPGNLSVAPSGVVWAVVEGTNAVAKFTPDSPLSGSTVYAETRPISVIFGAFFSGISTDPVTGEVYVLVTNFKSSWVAVYTESGTFLRQYGNEANAGEDAEIGGSAQGVAVLGSGQRVESYVGDNNLNGFAPLSKVAIWGLDIVEGPPRIRGTFASGVSADAATLHAQINPDTAETTYYFEYGLEDCSSIVCQVVPLGGAQLDAGIAFVPVSQFISGLQPGTTYHYRVKAENAFSPAQVGPDRTFTTQLSGLVYSLSDGRAWEMVSPSRKYGGKLEDSHWGSVQAAADGSGLAYLSAGSIEIEPEGNRTGERSTNLARRGPDGWESSDITLPNTEAEPGRVENTEYKLFTPDLAAALVLPRSRTLLSPAASDRTPYLRENTEPPTFTPLVTDREGYANILPGTGFGEAPFNFRIIGATPGFDHVVLSSQAPLLPEAEAGGLYVWEAGVLRLVSVLPEAEGGKFTPSSRIGSGDVSMRNAISADGERIFWSPGVNSVIHSLYLREVDKERSIRLDALQPGATGAGEPNPLFQGANPAGTVVFFTDTRQLTADSSPSGRDLYRCEIPAGPAPSGCATLTNISAPASGSGESARTKPLAPGLSEDGTRVYFVAEGILDTKSNEFGDAAAAGKPNLYLWQDGEGVNFIATLSKGDLRTWGGNSLGTEEAFMNMVSASISPSGRYFAFMSQRGLTGLDSSDSSSGNPVQEIFRYDAVDDDLGCISCNPTGAAPTGQSSTSRFLADPRGIWQGKWIAASLPETMTDIPTKEGLVFYSPRAALENGRLFFNSFDSLVPADANDTWDVYQYEPFGMGSCAPSVGGSAVSVSAGGCVSLISSGSAEGESGFLDASTSGDDVFFLTPAQLAVTDVDAELDAYDARVDGFPATLHSGSECSGEACQSAAAGPGSIAPASSEFRGQGNVRPKTCPKGRRKVRRHGRVRCVRLKHRKHQRRHHGRTSPDRRVAR